MLILSAGHYPEATGATWKNLVEFTETTKWINFIHSYLVTELGINSVTILPTGKLNKKVSRINSLYKVNDIAVELHFNSAGTTYVSGCETLYCPSSIIGKELAIAYHTAFLQNMLPTLIKNRGVKEGWVRGDSPNKVDFAGDIPGDEIMLYFLQKTNCRALILEPYFLCELENLKDWEISAKSIAKALASII